MSYLSFAIYLAVMLVITVLEANYNKAMGLII
jgi:hypothetical protein